jgi:hypothetical protein
VGRSITFLLQSLSIQIPEKILRCAQELDKHYIPSRYPDVYDQGASGDYYNRTMQIDVWNCGRKNFIVGERDCWKNFVRYILSIIQKLVVLFGSYARGDYTNESDVDGLIVSDVSPHDPREGFAMAYDIRFPKVISVVMNTLKVSDKFLRKI